MSVLPDCERGDSREDRDRGCDVHRDQGRESAGAGARARDTEGARGVAERSDVAGADGGYAADGEGSGQAGGNRGERIPRGVQYEFGWRAVGDLSPRARAGRAAHVLAAWVRRRTGESDLSGIGEARRARSDVTQNRRVYLRREEHSRTFCARTRRRVIRSLTERGRMSLSAQRRKLARAVVVCSLFLWAGIVRAQGNEPLSQPKTVPIELVTALVGSRGVSGPDGPWILVGSAPEWVMPRIVVPSGGRVLGAAFLGTTVLTIINIPLAGDSVIPELRRSLLDRGWKAVPVAQRMISPGGFMPAPPV